MDKSSKILFIVTLLAGILLANHSWNGLVYVVLGQWRAPASTRTLSDYTAIERKSLSGSIHTQLMFDAHFTQEGERIGLELGHPMLAKGSARQFSCNIHNNGGLFDHIEVVLIGTGVMEDGKLPQMTVTAPCHADAKPNRLDPIWIPMKDLMSGPPRDQELQTFGEGGLQIRLENMPSSWPENWSLWSVRFTNGVNSEDALFVDSNQLKEARPQLLSFSWTKN